jgi:hypothetical protein
MPESGETTYVIQRIWEGGWRVIQKKPDGSEMRIADFVNHGDAIQYVEMKYKIESEK